jgi:hypothetical protein
MEGKHGWLKDQIPRRPIRPICRDDAFVIFSIGSPVPQIVLDLEEGTITVSPMSPIALQF